jgi:ribonuclease HI
VTERALKLRLFVDGASRGNPGPAALGVVVTDGRGRPIAEIGEYLGETTNNVAEYRALLRGLREARQRGAGEIEIFADSDLLVRQIRGEYRVKSPHLAILHREVREALDGFARWQIRHVPRGQNAAADALANAAIDTVARAGPVELTVLVAREGSRWRAWVPALPGCEVVATTASSALGLAEAAARKRLLQEPSARAALPREHRIRITLEDSG